MSHFTKVKMQLKEKNLLLSALNSLNFIVTDEEDTENLYIHFGEPHSRPNSIAFAFLKEKESETYTLRYDLWAINTFGTGDYWNGFTEKNLEEIKKQINKEYTKQLVKREAEKLAPEYGEYILTEQTDGQFKLTFPQMQTVSV